MVSDLNIYNSTIVLRTLSLIPFATRFETNSLLQVSTFLFFLAPVTLIICLYIMIGVALRKSPLSRGSSDERSQGTLKQAPLPYQPRRVVVRMLGKWVFGKTGLSSSIADVVKVYVCCRACLLRDMLWCLVAGWVIVPRTSSWFLYSIF